jgi:hypothetical protein
MTVGLGVPLSYPCYEPCTGRLEFQGLEPSDGPRLAGYALYRCPNCDCEASTPIHRRNPNPESPRG